ncbi:TIGR03915 family putative DNA repair protein [Thermoclostridium stercorarium]|uniref:TIGR03915 family putative DNA repair protein n=1 Tax=Thermoclostridium stercorarium TaxID=1510 RepID=UPI0022488718|nr:TIGR03915 family putative DNA repair protein [Thermoclostridium stercorarium]UZQ85236.1 TIGR03915 family putative DNA repair protein [Thermoclostridium stercorarium]
MVYLFDGSFEGLLTCVFEAYSSKERDVSIKNKATYIPSFLDEVKEIETDMGKFERVYLSIPKKISQRAQEIVYRAWLSEDENAPDLIYYFLRIGYKMGGRVTDYLQDQRISKIIDLDRKVGREAHRFLGLLRFKEVAEGIFYAGYEPDYNITILIAPHFVRRLSMQSFIIHDRKRNISAVFDGSELVITDKVPQVGDEKTVEEDEYAALWKAFFKSIAIKERKNPRAQMRFMPKKYWKNLTEMQD